MNTGHTDIDPEVKSLLDEVIRDPNSVLLRPPKQRLSRLWSLREPALSCSTTFLNNVERHLLQRKREEVAHLLFEASKVALEDQPVVWESEPSLERLSTRLRTAQADELADEIGLLTSFAKADHGWPRPSELAAASLRMVPSDSARIQYALCLNAEDQPQLARRTLEDVLSHCPSNRDLSLARANYGFILAGVERREEAREWYGLAARTPEARPFCHMHWLIFAMRSGHEAEALEAGQSIADAFSADHREVESAIDNLRVDVDEEAWFPEKNSLRVVSRIREDGPVVARRLADVVA